MEIQKVIITIREALITSFAAVDTWFDKDVEMRAYRPATGGWTVDEILEHIGLTNHFLLILVNKGTGKALQNIHNLDLQTELQNATFNIDKLDAIGAYKSFVWIRPEHMEPTGEKKLAEVRQQLQQQLNHCLQILDRLKNGEGVLHKTTMTVNELGKINVYEYVYFLAQHARRHLMQMQNNEAESRGQLR